MSGGAYSTEFLVRGRRLEEEELAHHRSIAPHQNPVRTNPATDGTRQPREHLQAYCVFGDVSSYMSEKDCLTWALSG